MTTTLWDTTGTEVVKTLAAERRVAGAMASGLALTLITIADEKDVAAAEAAATAAAAAHPCRVIIVIRRRLDADDRLDAEVQVGGRLGPIEAVVLRTYGRLTLHAESVVLPLLASDAPVVTWWHGRAPEKIATDPLGVLADRRVTDAAAAEDPHAELHVRARDFAPGDTDLAWTRTTPWRSLLASAFDDCDHVPAGVTVHAERKNASAALLAGWLSKRLAVGSELRDSSGPGLTAVEVRFQDGVVLTVDRPDGRMATLSRSDRPQRILPLKRRDLGDLLAEELRRLDADEPYAEALAVVTGVDDLSERPAMRKHVWMDPAQAARAEPPSADKAPPRPRKTAAPKGAAGTTPGRRTAGTGARASSRKPPS